MGTHRYHITDDNVKLAAADRIDELLKESDAKIDEAVAIAREHGLSFDIDGPAYGMGGSFDPENTKDEWGEESGGWLASSNSC